MSFDGRVCLVGNPNTGKSTIFNLLTGMKQHTGNWSGKTVGSASGRFNYRGKCIGVVDLPGIYSLDPISEDERYAVEYLDSAGYDTVIVILDATCLERNLMLALEVLGRVKRAIVCVNLMDEARHKNIKVNLDALERELGVRVIGTSAAGGEGVDELKEAMLQGGTPVDTDIFSNVNVPERAGEIYRKCVDYGCDVYNCLDRRIDRIVMSRLWGLPIMLSLFALIFYITIVGANVPSAFLSSFFNSAEVWLMDISGGLPYWCRGLLIEGMFRTLGWVVSVMLPPMAVFFPLFTLLEDVGYLPRIAFVLDRIFKRAGAHGKMSLTVCMGFGCNAVGVTAARIIDSPRERLIAIITNSFIPCNGRFPSIIMLGGIFTAGLGTAFYGFKVTLTVLGCVIFSVIISLMASFVLSKTILKGVQSSFVLELPPYRKPRIMSILYRSLLDKTIFVFGRAVMVAAPAGAVIWLMQNITFEGISIIDYIASLLNGLGGFMGLDGYILTAFLLGMPANEIVLPLIIMCYSGAGALVEADSLSQLSNLLMANGWSLKTAVCTLVFMICHFPCSTTLLTIKKETGSIKWTLVSFFVPLITGILLCGAINMFFSLLSW